MPSRTSNKNLKKLPPLPAPQGRICIPVFVPDNVEWAALFLGALYELSLQSKYDRDEAHSAKLVASVWWNIWRDTVEFLRQGGTCGEAAMPLSWRFTQDCGLEFSSDGENWMAVEGWDTYAPDCFAGEDGEDGADGRDPVIRMTALSATQKAVEWRYSSDPDIAPSYRTAGYVSDGVDGREPEIRMVALTESTRSVQWKYTNEADTAWRTVGMVHDGVDGQSVTSVEVATGLPGTDAQSEYDPQTGALLLTIPRGGTGDDGEDGDTIDSITVTTLAAGEQATANFNSTTGLLTLGIPRGDTGEAGQDCACDTVPPQPPIEVGDDRYALACNIAIGLGEYLHTHFDDSLEFIEAGIEAAQAIETIVSGFIDAFPVFGAIVDAVLDFATETIQAGAEETRAANGNYFKEMIQQQLFCSMVNDTSDFDQAYLGTIKGELQQWGASLPLQTPLFVAIGQIFSVWLNNVPDAEMLRRANVYKGSAQNCNLFQCGNGIVQFASDSSTVAENAGTHVVTVQLALEGGALANDVTVEVAAAGTATPTTDYTYAPTLITFPAGSADGATQNVTITLVNDTLDDNSETIILTLQNVSAGGALGAQVTHTVGIVDDDEAGGGTWCYAFNFVTSNGGWVADNLSGSLGTWENGVGWRRSVTSGTTYRARAISISKAVNSFVTTVTVQTVTPNHQQMLVDLNSAFYPQNDGIVEAQTSQNFVINVNDDVTTLGIGLDRNAQAGLSSVIVGIVIEGTGMNPFGADNC